MDVMTLTARLGLDSSAYEKGLQQAQGGLKNLGSNITNTIKSAAKVGSIAFSAAATVVGALTKSAVSAYGEYQQLAGGIETLYGDSAQTVIANAEKAYTTAGKSANEYMDAVISLSGSLLKSLGGDTEEAARLSDVAIRDMADNVNKMGTDAAMVESAYRGFARQNFTMLDNLALGYAGTKEGMEELLKDAEKITHKKYDISSLADIIDAIHVIQDEMGITGTTADEAEGTITGSLASVRAAWQNLLTAFGRGQDVKKAFKAFAATARSFVGNIIPVVKNALVGIGEFIGELGPVIIEELPGLIRSLLPSLLSAVGKLIVSLGRALPQLMKSLLYGIHVSFREFNKWLSGQNKQLGQAFTNLRIPFIKAFHGISKYWEGTAKPALQGAWKYITGTFIPDIKGAIDNATGENGIDWSKLWQGLSEIDLVDKLKTLFAAVPGKISELLGSAAEFLEGGTFAGFADTFYGIIEKAFKAGSGGNTAKIASAISGIFTAENFANLITISGDFGSVIINALSAAITGTVEGITDLTEAAAILINQGLEALTSDEFATSAETAIGKFWDAIVAAVGNIGDAATRLAIGIRTVLTNALTDSNISKLFGENGTIRNLAGRVITGLVEAIGKVQDASGKIAGEIAALIQGINWTKLTHDLTATATGLIDKLFSGLSETDFEGVAGKIGTLLGSAMAALSNAAVGIAQAIGEWFLSGQVFVTLWNVAKGIVTGLWSFITSALASIWDNNVIMQYLKGIGQAVTDWANNTFFYGVDNVPTVEIGMQLDIDGSNEKAYDAVQKIIADTREYIASGASKEDILLELEAQVESLNLDETNTAAFENSGVYERLVEMINGYFDGNPVEVQPSTEVTPETTIADATTYVQEVQNQITKDLNAAMDGAEDNVSPVPVAVDTANLAIAQTDVETAFSTMQEIAEAATLTLTIDAETPIAKAIRTVRAGISILKNMMNFRWKLPDLKVPHFSLSGAFDLQAGTVPKVDVKWYARAMRNGMILDDPTIFGMDGGSLLGAGEVGPEAVVGVNSLQGMVREAAQNAVSGMVSVLLAELQAIHDDMPTGNIVMDTGALVGSTVKSMDMALNDVAKWRGRGRA